MVITLKLHFSSPANYLLQKPPISKFVATNLLIWGMLVMCMAAIKNFAGAASIRFLMGLSKLVFSLLELTLLEYGILGMNKVRE
jgi:hypothetical protein